MTMTPAAKAFHDALESGLDIEEATRAGAAAAAATSTSDVDYASKGVYILALRCDQLLKERDEAAEALKGIFSYACTGASMSDVNTFEQPQFIRARAVMREYEREIMRSRGEL